MLTRKSGIILNMSSVAGLIAAPMYTIYAATKFGVTRIYRRAAPGGERPLGVRSAEFIRDRRTPNSESIPEIILSSATSNCRSGST